MLLYKGVEEGQTNHSLTQFWEVSLPSFGLGLEARCSKRLERRGGGRRTAGT